MKLVPLNLISHQLQKRKCEEKQRERGYKRLDPDTILLKLSLFHPVTHLKTQELICPSSLSLSDLRRHLSCRLCELFPAVAASDPSFLFIEGVFYDEVPAAGNDQNLFKTLRLSK